MIPSLVEFEPPLSQRWQVSVYISTQTTVHIHCHQAHGPSLSQHAYQIIHAPMYIREDNTPDIESLNRKIALDNKTKWGRTTPCIY
jgi:hypothetical protein